MSFLVVPTKRERTTEILQEWRPCLPDIPPLFREKPSTVFVPLDLAPSTRLVEPFHMGMAMYLLLGE